MTRISLVVIALVALLVGCSHHSNTQDSTPVDVTFNLMGQVGLAPLHNDAILLVVLTDDLHRHGIARPADVDRWQVVVKRFRSGVERNKLTQYKRFIIAEDDVSRVVVTYPETEIRRELK